MDPKKLYFLLATAATAGAVAGAYGSDVVFSSATLTGRAEAIVVEDIIRPIPAGVVTSLQNRVHSQSCPSIDAKHGVGSCDPTTIDFDIIYHRKRGREWYVRRYRQFNQVERGETAAGVASWLDTRIGNNYCTKVNQRYGPICEGATIDYVVRFIRSSGQTRARVQLSAPAFCTAAPPNDPTPPGAP